VSTVKTSDVQAIVSALSTAHEVRDLFRRTEMSLLNYRNREHDPLPAVMMDNRVVGYVKDDVYDWAGRNGIKVHEKARH
jgi:hypothetical protein